MASPLPDVAPPSSEEDIQRVFSAQQAHAPAVRHTSAEQRRDKLERLRDGLLARRARFQEALQADFRKAPVETDLTDLKPVLDELQHAIKHLDDWMAADRVDTPLLHLGTRSEVHYEPKGVVLILSPWNYPLLLTIGPLVSALAAGNCAVLKPSEHTPCTTAVTKELIEDLFPEHEVALLPGAAEVGQVLLHRPFDHIYFTGSPRVGRIVMKAAAEHLTSVTLELGGKSPALVDATADLEQAASRIAWSKFMNAGQTCIAPDYVLVEEPVHDAVVEHLRGAIHRFYGATAAARRESRDYPRLIHEDHTNRMADLLATAVDAGANVAAGGTVDRGACYVSPTVLTDVPLDTTLMQQEIFGPLLPILSVESLDEALHIVNERPPPLSLYLFTEDEATVDAVLGRTTAGSTCVNEGLLHFNNPELPFGGVGESGFGRGHGEAGFRAFSNERSVLRRSYGSALLRMLYPPYDSFTNMVVDKILRYF